MKKYFKFALVFVMVLSLFVITGCDKKTGNTKKEEKKDWAKITYDFGKVTMTAEVPKDEDGKAKYEFTKDKPTTDVLMSRTGSVYLVTDDAIFAFGSTSWTYQTGQKYKEKYGEVKKGNFDDYMKWVKDKDSGIDLRGMEELKINGRKAVRYYSFSGGSGNYKYYGYFYTIDVNEFYEGSRLDMNVYYNIPKSEVPTEAKELSKETLEIIKTLKFKANE